MITTLFERFMGPTWCPSGADRTRVGPILAPWTLLSGKWPFFLNSYLTGYNIAMYTRQKLLLSQSIIEHSMVLCKFTIYDWTWSQPMRGDITHATSFLIGWELTQPQKMCLCAVIYSQSSLNISDSTYSHFGFQIHLMSFVELVVKRDHKMN